MIKYDVIMQIQYIVYVFSYVVSLYKNLMIFNLNCGDF